MGNAFASAFARDRPDGPLIDHRVLRIETLLVERTNWPDVIGAVLDAEAERLAQQLPAVARAGQPFQAGVGHSTCTVSRHEDGQALTWKLIATAPSGTAGIEAWVTTLSLISPSSGPVRIVIEVAGQSRAWAPDIFPRSPQMIVGLADRVALEMDGEPVSSKPWRIESRTDAEDLVDLLLDHGRSRPVVVLSCPESDPNPFHTKIPADALAKSMCGLAHVVVLPGVFTWQVTDAVGRTRSVFGGSIRLYRPGSVRDATAADHLLIHINDLATRAERDRCGDLLRRNVARWSLAKLEHLRPPIEVSPKQNELAAIEVREPVASQSETVAASDAAGLAERMKQVSAENEYYLAEYANAELQAKEAKAAERLALKARDDALALCRQLEEQLRRHNLTPEFRAAPANWSELAAWVAETFADQIEITTAARNLLDDPGFQNLAQVVRALRWLAITARPILIEGGRPLRDEMIEPGLWNSPSGSDAFDVMWQGRRHTIDWHVKTGGNTRNRARCLRIYYGWDEVRRVIVVAHLPGHRRTGAT
jgi:hypothetical protein